MKNVLVCAVAALVTASAANAKELKVMADIAPVHSIVARVMEGAGEPGLIVRPEESPHDFAMRPSIARSLQDAAIVFWMGEGIAPKLEKPLESVAGGAKVVNLTEVEGTVQYDFREVAVFEDDHHDGHDDHAEKHDDHDDHADSHDDHDDHDDHKDHGDAHDSHDDERATHDDHHDDEHTEGHDGHDDHHHHHDGLDPHMWLDPENAKVWAGYVASVLSEADPENASVYTSNADALVSELDVATQEIEAKLANVADSRFVVFHDAYQYFEKRFGLSPAGALLESDARSPSAGRLAEIQEVIAEEEIDCVFVEPQYDPRLVDAVAAKAKTGEMDPLGAGFEPGANLYLNVLNTLADNVAGCLAK